jgi:hypothetical protein
VILDGTLISIDHVAPTGRTTQASKNAAASTSRSCAGSGSGIRSSTKRSRREWVIFLAPVGMMIVAAPGRLPGRLVGVPALVTGLATVQVLIANLAQSIHGTARHDILGLRAVGGAAILGVPMRHRNDRPTGAGTVLACAISTKCRAYVNGVSSSTVGWHTVAGLARATPLRSD